MVKPKLLALERGKQAIVRTASRVKEWIKARRRPLQKIPPIEYLVLENPKQPQLLEKLVGAVHRTKGAAIEKSEVTTEKEDAVTKGTPVAKIRITGLTARKELWLRKKFELRLLPQVPPLPITKIESVRIIPAKPNDLEEIYALEKKCFPNQKEQAGREDWKDRLDFADVFKAVDASGKIIGFHAGSLMGRKIKHLRGRIITSRRLDKLSPFWYHYQFFDIGVDPEHQGRKIGQMLFERAVKQALDRKVTRIYAIGVNPKSGRLLEKNGFVHHSDFPARGRTRAYMFVVKTGRQEKDLKDSHEEAQEILKKLPETKTFSDNLKYVAKWMEHKFPELTALHPTEKSTVIRGDEKIEVPSRIGVQARFITDELLFHHKGEKILKGRNFRTTRTDINIEEYVRQRLLKKLGELYSEERAKP